MAERKEPKGCSELAVSLAKIAYNQFERPGVDTFDAAVKRIREMLPGVERKDIAQAIGAYERARESEGLKGTFPKFLKLRAEAVSESDILERISLSVENLKNAVVEPKTPAEKKSRSMTVEALRRVEKKLAARERDLARVKELEKQLAAEEFPEPQRRPAAPEPTTPEGKRRAKLEEDKAQILRERAEKAAKARAEQRKKMNLENRIEAFEKELSTGEWKKSPEAAERLRSEREELESLLRRKVTAGRTTAELREQIEKGEFVRPERKPTATDAQLERLEFERDRLRARVRSEIEGMKPKRWYVKYGVGPMRGASRLMGSLLTTGEFSGILNQGGQFVLSNAAFHPKRVGRTIKTAFEAFANPVMERRLEKTINDHPDRPLMEKAGLKFTDAVTAREEQSLSNLVDNLPVIGNFSAFHRTFLNAIRLESWEILKDALGPGGEITRAEAESIARFINAATGRTELGPHGLNELAADFAFAPRYYASRVSLLSGAPLLSARSPRAFKAIALQYGKYAMALGTITLLGKMVGGESEDDPRSSDFGKIRFGEKTRISFASGMAQWVTAAARLASQSSVDSSGRVHKFTKTSESFNVLGRLGSGRLSPGARLAWEGITRKDFFDQPMTKGKFLQEAVAFPITYQDVYDEMTAEDGLGLPAKLALNALAVVGAQAQIYTDKKKKGWGERLID